MVGGKRACIISSMLGSLKPGEKGILVCPSRHRATSLAKYIRDRFEVKAKSRVAKKLGQPIMSITDEFSPEPTIRMIPNDELSYFVEIWR